MAPILLISDKRVQKQKDKYAVLCWHKGQQKFHFFHVDNLPEKEYGWQAIKIVWAATSGLTISESIYKLNQELSRVKIKRVR